MIITYIIIILSTFIAAFAGFFLKKSTYDGTIIETIKNKYFYIGGFLYVLSASFGIWVLKRIPYSIAVPLGSLCYIWTMIIANVFLKEKITIGKIIGVSLILTGVVFIAV